MKKLWVVLSVFLAATTAFADVADVAFDGRDLAPTVRLQDVEKHTVYENRDVPSTCHRTEQQGLRTECHTDWSVSCGFENRCHPVTKQVCGLVGGIRVCRNDLVNECHLENVCHNTSREICQNVPNIVDVAYSCLINESVPVGEELDYHVTADVALQFDAAPAGIQPREKVEVSLNGSRVDVNAIQASGQLLLVATPKLSTLIVKEKTAGQPGEKQVTGTIEIKLIPVRDVVSPTSAPVADLDLQAGVLKFSSAKIVLPELVQVSVKIDRDIKLWPDHTLFDGVISTPLLAIAPSGDRSQVSVPLNQIALDEALQAGTLYHVTVSVKVVPQRVAGLLNPATLPPTSEVSLERDIQL